MDINVNVKYVRDNIEQAAYAPHYATTGAAGMDLYACIDAPIIIKAGQIQKIPTGIAVQIPDKHIGGFVFPRSGLSSKHGISMINSVGVIDSDYTGEIICPLINHSNEAYTINNGDRIAQIVFMPVCIANINIVKELNKTERGTGGFGSTGV